MEAPELTGIQATVIGLLIHEQGALVPADIVSRLVAAGASGARVIGAVGELVAAGLLGSAAGERLAPTSAAHLAFLVWHGRVGREVDGLHGRPELEDCPSVPWLTAVQTEWIEAISLNYRVDPEALSPLLPPPLRPECARGAAWVQILMSSLRDMRPQGLGALFGVSFYQASYRAAVCLDLPSGELLRGGYFLRSDTNHALMRTIGNKLAEFKFHAFGHAHMVLARDGAKLVASVEALSQPGGDLVGIFDVNQATVPPKSSVWTTLDELQHPLVECYDAFACDRGHVYVLSIDRTPWNARFCNVDKLYSEYFSVGPLTGAATFDSALHIPRSAYRWQTLRRLRHAGVT